MKALERFRAGKAVKLRDEDAGATPLREHSDKNGEKSGGKHAKGEIKERERTLTAELTAEAARLQEMLYAGRRKKLLLVLQGMDTAGKDGTVRALFSQINPMGLRATAFAAPTERERAHDFLWRVTRALPARGMIGIFNRSQYEEVLVARVHPEILKAQRLPPSLADGKHFWDHRLEDIAGFERHLGRQGTKVVKFCW